MTTPALDAAIRAGCATAYTEIDCPFPGCVCQKIPIAIQAALHAALTETPELVEAITRATWERWRTTSVAAESCRDVSWERLNELATEHNAAAQLAQAGRGQAVVALAALRKHLGVEEG